MLKKTIKQNTQQVVEPSDELIKPYLDIIEEKEQCIIETIGTVNDLLQFMTNLDYVKDMIKDANIQSSMVESAAASSEELAASTEDISNYVQESNANMDHAIGETNESLLKVDKTFKKIEDDINEISVVNGIMSEVAEETVKINELVNVIKSVADQTNLLSLNASIEAARAGEQGRGFAVVANEIKKLAENTKEQVNIISAIVKGLNSKIGSASGEIERVIRTFTKSKVAIDEATEGIKGISTTMSLIGDSFTSISANVEEQTATTQEMSSNLQIISEKSTKLKAESDKTGQAFFDISQKVNEIRIKATRCSKKVDTITMVDLSITDHLMWKWRVYNMILGYEQLNVSDVGDHHGCRLGKWVSTIDQNNTSVMNVIKKMDQPHSEVHSIAKKAIQEYYNGNIQKAEDLLLEIEANSKLVVDYLTELKKFF